MRLRHFLHLLLLAAFWGASFPLMRFAAPYLGPFGVAFGRCVLGALVLALLLRVSGQSWPARHQWRPIVPMSVLTVAGPFLLYNSAALVLPGGYIGLLNAMVPLFGVVAGVIFERERFTASKVAGCVIGLAGVALLVKLGPVAPDASMLLAVFASILASAGYAFGAVVMKRSTARIDPLPAAAAVHVVSGCLLLAPAAVAAPSMHPTLPALATVFVLGTITSGLVYWLNLRLLQHIPASAATSASFMVPLFAVSWGALFFGEPFTAGMVPGVALVLVACALVTGFNPLRALLRLR